MKHWMVVLAAVGFLVSAGCVTRGKQFSSDTSWIKKNLTKKSDVQMVLGMPYQTGQASSTQTWTYGYYNYSLFGSSNTKELKFYWTPDGAVESFVFSSSFPDDVRRATVVRQQGDTNSTR
jgi:hypothetical protein